MAIPIAWQSDSSEPSALWLVEGNSSRIGSLPCLSSRWQRLNRSCSAGQIRPIPSQNFWRCCTWRSLIDLSTLRRLLAEHMPLYRIWAQLREFCRGR